MAEVQFRFRQLVPNESGATLVTIPVAASRGHIVASLAGGSLVTIQNPGNYVLLEASVGWQATGPTTVLFEIFHQFPGFPRTIIYSQSDSIETGTAPDNQATAAVTTVDIPRIGSTGPIRYFLYASVISGTTAELVGPVTFTATQFTV